ncbi:hypothetical protein HOLleu_13003 [Holothuria leucospilota]|uniref:Uncharacterized protein n=1 Tax=Holothuria leucospilota TaxID=206669 RepID=A0A9Q1CBU3_HOLLE|nr:hypothetical protein HOLleu_13003 [Holothuria leucospilota]
MATPGPLTVCKVLNSSPALAELKKHPCDHSLVSFTCGDFSRLCIAQGGEIPSEQWLVPLRTTARHLDSLTSLIFLESQHGEHLASFSPYRLQKLSLFNTNLFLQMNAASRTPPLPSCITSTKL